MASEREVHAAVRSGGETSASHTFPWQIGDPLPSRLLDAGTVIVHLAATTRPGVRGSLSVPQDDPEVFGARTLLRQAADAGSRLVFVSSQSAAPDAPSHYGRIKWAIQQDVLAAQQIALQLGLVHGDEERGLFGRLQSLARRMPILPMPHPPPKVQLTPIVWASRAIERLGNADLSPGLYAVARPQPVALSNLLSTLAEEAGSCQFFLPFPAIVLDGFWKLTRRVDSAVLVTLDQLMALMKSRPLNTIESLRRLGLDEASP